MVWAGAVGPQDRAARRYQRVRRPARSSPSRPATSSARSTSPSAPAPSSPPTSACRWAWRPASRCRPGATSPVLRIGDRCSIGRGSHLVAHRSVVIGDDVMTGPHCYVTDQNHVYADPDVPVGQQWPSRRPGRDRRRVLAGRRGRDPPGHPAGPEHASSAPGAVVRGDFPDHAVLAGVPAKVDPTLRPRHRLAARPARAPHRATRGLDGEAIGSRRSNDQPGGRRGRHQGNLRRALRGRGRRAVRQPRSRRRRGRVGLRRPRRARPWSTSGAGRSTTKARPGPRTRSSTSGRPPRP